MPPFFRRRRQGSGIGHPGFSARDGRMKFPENRVLTPGRPGVISRPPQTGGPASTGQPETPTAPMVLPEDKGSSRSRFLSYCPRADVLSSCRNAGASCFGLLRRLYDGQPVQTARIFDNRIGLLEASTLYACCWRCPLGLAGGVGVWQRAVTSRVVSGA